MLGLFRQGHKEKEADPHEVWNAYLQVKYSFTYRAASEIVSILDYTVQDEVYLLRNLGYAYFKLKQCIRNYTGS